MKRLLKLKEYDTHSVWVCGFTDWCDFLTNMSNVHQFFKQEYVLDALNTECVPLYCGVTDVDEVDKDGTVLCNFLKAQNIDYIMKDGRDFGDLICWDYLNDKWFSRGILEDLDFEGKEVDDRSPNQYADSWKSAMAYLNNPTYIFVLAFRNEDGELAWPDEPALRIPYLGEDN